MSTFVKRPPAVIRHQNPGAQWPGKIATKWGSTGHEVLNDGLGQGNKIATFPSWENGAAAHIDLLRTNYGGLPLHKAIHTWSGGNNSIDYLKRVNRETGLAPDTIINDDLLMSPRGLALVKSMAQHEAGKDGKVPADMWERAQAKVFGGLDPRPRPEITEPDDARAFLAENASMPKTQNVAPSGPTVVQGAMPQQDASKASYSKALAKALMDTQLSKHVTPLEGISYALSKGVGAWNLVGAEQEEKAKTDAAVASLPEQYRALAQLDPKHAHSLLIQESRERAAADRQANQFTQQQNVNQRQHEQRLEVEREKARLDLQGKLEAGAKVHKDERTGKMLQVFPDGTAREIKPQDAAPQKQPQGQNQPQAMPGGVTKINDEPQVEPVADKKQSADYGPRIKVNPDGTAQLGPRTVNTIRSDGTNIPRHVFSHAVEDAPDKVTEERNYGNAKRYSEETEKYYIPAAREAVKTMDSIDRFQKLNASTPTGWGGEIALMAAQVADRLGVTDGKYASSAEAMKSLTQGFSKAAKEGLPGAVSNYEQQTFMRASPNIENSPMGNWLVGEGMRVSALRAMEGSKSLNNFHEDKKQAGLSATTDRGFEGYRDEHMKGLGDNLLDPYADKALKLLSQGKKAEAQAVYKDYLREKHGIGALPKKSVSTDGTLPKSAAPAVAPQGAQPAAEIIEDNGKKYRTIRDKNGNVVDFEEVG